MQRCNIAVFATVCLAVFPASHGHGHSLSGEVAAFRRLQQYTQYGQPLTTGNGAANDADVGWTSSDANGYSAVPVTCDAGLVQCHGRADCVDLSTNPLYCGTCQTNCDFFTQICQAGACTCKQGFSPCPTRGGRCLDAESCPPGPSPASSTSPTPQGSTRGNPGGSSI